MDTRDDPAAQRPGYGNAELHTWWPLTPPEVAAIRGVDAAKAGDAHALLALALVSSGDRRDADSHAEFTARVDHFLADIKPTIAAAADDWHRGYELNRAMHRVFFAGKRADLGGYELDQGRLTGIFTTSHYNCLSSAVLYVVLARAFGLPVRAVVVPTHVFVQIGAGGAQIGAGPGGGRVIEIETTSNTGFDWVHDARFYKDDAASWSSSRGLRPVTFDEYQHRRIIAPYQLMALAMRDGRSGEDDADRARLHELAALVDADDVEIQRDRMQYTENEAIQLFDAKAWRTVARLFDVVSPAVDALAASTHDAKTGELASWETWSYAHALAIVGRTDEAMARMGDGYARLDPTWPDAEKLRNNYVAVLNDRLCGLIEAKDYAKALEVYAAHREPCRADKVCTDNIAVIYGNQSIDSQNAGDWQTARDALQKCVAEVPDGGRCRDALADLESRHRF
ncbi:MAG: tetratricopeptide repeat domain protein [Myxococcales bacterium]|nr:tetratricopeptide repeat domain protein [Myxococcales bacterium]